MQAGGQDGAPAVVSGQPQVTEGDCRGQGPQEASHCAHSVKAETIPSPPRRSRPRGTASLHLPAPPAGLP